MAERFNTKRRPNDWQRMIGHELTAKYEIDHARTN
jgi:alcohol dehydrogenase YqhD (iron-dependent ADH family)